MSKPTCLALIAASLVLGACAPPPGPVRVEPVPAPAAKPVAPTLVPAPAHAPGTR